MDKFFLVFTIVHFPEKWQWQKNFRFQHGSLKRNSEINEMKRTEDSEVNVDIQTTAFVGPNARIDSFVFQLRWSD